MRSLALLWIVLVAACARSPDAATVFRPQLDRAVLEFVTTATELPAAQQLGVSAGESSGLAWRATAEASWLRFGPADGFTPSVLIVNVDPAGLPPGAHEAALRIDFGAPNEPVATRDVLVRLTVLAPGWTLTEGPDGGTITALAARGAHVLAGDPEGALWESNDGGASFARLAQLGGVIRDVYLGETVAYALSATSGLWRSDDGGASWQTTALAAGGAQLVVASDDPTRLYVRNGTSNAIVRSVDGGASWTSLALIGRAYCIAGGTARPEELLVCGEGWTSDRTLDDGASWDHFLDTALYPKVMLRSETEAGFLLAAGTSGTISLSRDDGVTWRRDAVGVPMGEARDLEQFGGTYFLATSVGLAESSDGAAYTRTIAERSVEFDDFGTLAHTDTELVVAHAALGVLRGAATLTPATGLRAHRPRSISVDPQDGRLLVTTDRSGLWIRSPEGAWTPRVDADFFPAGATAVERQLLRDPNDPAHLLAYQCPGGVLRSIDGGQSWEKTGANAGDCVSRLAWSPDDANVVYASNGVGLLRSTDRAATFTLIRSFSGSIRSLALLPGGDLLVFFWYHECEHYRAASDSWEDLNGPGDFTHTAVENNGTTWVAGPSGLLVFRGDTLTRVAPASTQGVTGLIAGPSGIFLARDGIELVRSRDEGSSWENLGCPSDRVSAIALDESRQTLWVGTADLGVLGLGLE